MKKMAFTLVISAEGCNPNGDPADRNRPRHTIEGYGEISDVCIKKKVRNRLQDMGYEILIPKQERITDGVYSINAKIETQKELEGLQNNPAAFREVACRIWTDVRFFGHVFAYKGNGPRGVSIHVRGPVSLGVAKTLDLIDIVEYKITKTMNIEDRKQLPPQIRDSSTLGSSYKIDHGAYVTFGGITPQVAELTGFSEEDVKVLKKAFVTLFENDASSCRPAGSMSTTLFWWEYDDIRYNPAKLMRSLNLKPANEWPYFAYSPDEIAGIDCKIYTVDNWGELS